MTRRRAASFCALWVVRPRAVAPCSWTAPTWATETRALACALGYVPVVPPNPLRRRPWRLDCRLYRRRNEVERLFRRLKSYRRVFTRYDKLDAMFLAFVHLALIFDALR